MIAEMYNISHSAYRRIAHAMDYFDDESVRRLDTTSFFGAKQKKQ